MGRREGREKDARMDETVRVTCHVDGSLFTSSFRPFRVGVFIFL